MGALFRALLTLGLAYGLYAVLKRILVFTPKQREAFGVVGGWLAELVPRLFAAFGVLVGLVLIYGAVADEGWGVRILGTLFGLFVLFLGIRGLRGGPTDPGSDSRRPRATPLPPMSWRRRLVLSAAAVGYAYAAVAYADHRASVADRSVVSVWHAEDAESLAEDAAALARHLAAYRAEGAEGDSDWLATLEGEARSLALRYQGLTERLYVDMVVYPERLDADLLWPEGLDVDMVRKELWGCVDDEAEYRSSPPPERPVEDLPVWPYG